MRALSALKFSALAIAVGALYYSNPSRVFPFLDASSSERTAVVCGVTAVLYGIAHRTYRTDGYPHLTASACALNSTLILILSLWVLMLQGFALMTEYGIFWWQWPYWVAILICAANIRILRSDWRPTVPHLVVVYAANGVIAAKALFALLSTSRFDIGARVTCVVAVLVFLVTSEAFDGRLRSQSRNLRHGA
jgi:hypothetical protein